MNRYISDLHIGCTNKYENRTLEHDKLIVEHWNQIVHNDDTTYILGDIGRIGTNKDNSYLVSILSQLKGKKVLVLGNHDLAGLKDVRITTLFDEIIDYKEITDCFDGKAHKLVLSHYPIFSWNGCYKDTTLLYGHTHSNFDDKIFQDSLSMLRDSVDKINEQHGENVKFKARPYAYNVGVMIPYMNYRPRTLKEILVGDNVYNDTEKRF